MSAVDFAVVGAGIAGASAAHELTAHGTVKVFEMEATAGYHSTGRSAALYTECDGPAPLRRLAMASKPFLTAPPEGFSATPLVHPRGVLFVARRGNGDLLDTFSAQQRDLVANLRRLAAEEAASLCSALRPDRLTGGVLEPDAMDIEVHALHQGFLRSVRERGGMVATAAPVTGLKRQGTGWRVSTPRDTVDAGVVVNAAGAWCDRVAEMAGVTPVGLQPKRRTAFTFAAPEGSAHGAWPMVVDVGETFYFRPEGPGLLGSPEDQTPVEPQDVRHEEIDVALAIERIQDVTTMTIRHVRAAWAGLRSFVADNIPVVGMDPDASGFLWLAGQGGYGIMTSPAMGRIAAALATGDTLPTDIAELGIDTAELAPDRLR